MSSTTGMWHAAPKGYEPASPRVRALLRALREWWGKERYRPERRYMRG
jgi:hypothetical protein